ncbi:outer membrane beta-barrel protein [Flavobacterium sp. TMP13]|uniref:outer membrane beta-barrel protein n=1 Tax=unclassified Flavobacterium TaxID=196869 RepID=UPI00076D038A|nr:outer membrane beta-barrel protein [Flavobacterium sp. TAB 87]KVV15400.1 hypothetical protein AP058_01066 [Flavobacterium sp. TAB 87]
MKKILLTAVAVFAFSFANAQDSSKSFGFSEGDVLVEGNFSFNSTNDKNTDTKTNSLGFNPKVGYFLTDKFALGLELEVANGSTEVAGIDTKKSSNFGAGVFGRYYFLELGERFKTYAEVGVDFNNGKDGLGNMETKYSGVGFGAGLGLNYFVTENFAINFGLSDILGYSSYKVEDGKAVSGFGANLNVFNNFFATANFGLTFKL